MGASASKPKPVEWPFIFSESGYLEAYLVFSVFLQLFQDWLEKRQLSKDREPTIPKLCYDLGVLKAGDEQEKEYYKVQDYNIEKRQFGRLKSWWGFGLGVWGAVWLHPKLWKA